MASSGWLLRATRLGRSAPVALALLVGANLVPLAGVLWLGWEVRPILILYWIENGIIGLLNVPKMLLAAGTSENRSVPLTDAVGRTFNAGFFVVHYGMFWFIHGVFVLALTGNSFDGFADPVAVIAGEPGLLLGALALLASHSASFWLNYIRRREYLRISPGAQMFMPYLRVVVLHMTVLLGGVAIVSAGQPVQLLVLLVVFKTIADVIFHLIEHSRYRQAVATG